MGRSKIILLGKTEAIEGSNRRVHDVTSLFRGYVGCFARSRPQLRERGRMERANGRQLQWSKQEMVGMGLGYSDLGSNLPYAFSGHPKQLQAPIIKDSKLENTVLSPSSRSYLGGICFLVYMLKKNSSWNDNSSGCQKQIRKKKKRNQQTSHFIS